jgi:Sigma-70, region 4
MRTDGRTSAPDACICLGAGRRPLPEQNRALLIRMTHLYLCEGMSTYRIAQLTGLDRQRVARLLRKAGVPLRPYGAGGIAAERRRGDPPNLAEILTDLYVYRHLTIAQIGALLGIPKGTVRNRLRRYGIRVRTQGQWEREGRQVLPADVLWDLYGRDGLPADDIGRRLGTSRGVVLRNAHDLGVPVRTGGSVPRSGRSEIELINALYADELVDAVLAQHKIPRVPPGAPIWQRFPDPVPLSRQLVEDLYWCCGLGLNHIERLTGQPAQTVGGLMRRCGITRRHPGGLSPFLRRWRTGSPGDAYLPPGSTRPNPRIGSMPVSRPSQSERGPATNEGSDR